MTDFALSTVFSRQRRKIVTLTASDAAVAIPTWAQGGKGIMYVSGCAGGGGGAVRATTGSRGGGGASSGGVVRLPMSIPSGVTTLAVAIGAGGHGPSATAQTDGSDGGDTTLTIGSDLALRVAGAKGGLGTNVGGAGTTTISLFERTNVNSTTNTFAHTAVFGSTQNYFFGNVAGGAGNVANSGYGAGASNLWGRGGNGIAAAPSANTAGENGQGYGTGGAGALWLSGAAAKAGDGAHGFMQIEFVEGF